MRGEGRTERHYLDFVIDGASLQDQLRVGDLVTALGGTTTDTENAYIDELSSAGRRLPLYMCAECGDLACGAVTVLVETMPDAVVWRDFMFENGYDGSIADAESYRGVGPFAFDRTEYLQLLREAGSEPNHWAADAGRFRGVPAGERPGGVRLDPVKDWLAKHQHIRHSDVHDGVEIYPTDPDGSPWAVVAHPPAIR